MANSFGDIFNTLNGTVTKAPEHGYLGLNFPLVLYSLLLFLFCLSSFQFLAFVKVTVWVSFLLPFLHVFSPFPATLSFPTLIQKVPYFATN